MILQAYYALRRSRVASDIGTPEILRWIEHHEPNEHPDERAERRAGFDGRDDVGDEQGLRKRCGCPEE